MIFQSVNVLEHPVKENDLIQPDQVSVLNILKETQGAHFPIQAHSARVGTMAEFSWVAPVGLLVTHFAFNRATRQKVLFTLFMFRAKGIFEQGIE